MKYILGLMFGFILAFALSASAGIIEVPLWNDENQMIITQPAEEHEVETATKTRDKVRGTNEAEMECLALNIYHEARGSIFVDMAAVTDVVLNRVQDRRYPNTVCSVVKQAKMSKWHLENTGKQVPVRHKCQFSWFCDGRSDYPYDKESWERAKHLAYNMYYYNEYRGITEGATHYHATYVSPSWASHFQLVGRIGDHVFYRWVD